MVSKRCWSVVISRMLSCVMASPPQIGCAAAAAAILRPPVFRLPARGCSQTGGAVTVYRFVFIISIDRGKRVVYNQKR